MHEQVKRATEIVELIESQGCHTVSTTALVFARYKNVGDDGQAELIKAVTRDCNNLSTVSDLCNEVIELIHRGGKPTPFHKALSMHSAGSGRDVGSLLNVPYKSCLAALASKLDYWLFEVGVRMDDARPIKSLFSVDQLAFRKKAFWLIVRDTINDQRRHSAKVALAEHVAQCINRPWDIDANDALMELATFECPVSPKANPLDELKKIAKQLKDQGMNRPQIRAEIRANHRLLLAEHDPQKANDDAYPTDATVSNWIA